MDDRNRRARVADVDDADELAQLLHDFNTEFAVPSPGTAVLAHRLRRLLSSEQVFAIVAGTPAVAVGLVTLRPNVWYEGRVATLDELYVVPRLRNHGIGAAVLDHVVQTALASGVDAMEINVDEGDADAQRFYARHGFSTVDPGTRERAFYLFRALRGSSSARIPT